MTASLGLEPAPPPLIRAREAHNSNGLRIYASVGHGARRRHSASCRRPPCTGLYQRQRERLVHQGPRRPGVGCRHVQVAIPRRGGVAFPQSRRPHRADRRQQQLQCPARRGLAGGIVHVPHGFEPSARSEFHEPSLQTARDSGPPHRQVFTLSAVQPSRELARRSHAYRCRAATTIRHCGRRSSRASRSSSSWIRAGIRNVSRR